MSATEIPAAAGGRPGRRSAALAVHLLVAALFPARAALAQADAPSEAGAVAASPAAAPQPVWSPPPPAPLPPPLAPAPEEPAGPAFGAAGQFVITGASSAGVSWSTFDGSQAQSFSVGLSPGLDYFVHTNFSVGLDLTASYGDGRGYGADSSLVETRTTTLHAGVRAGWNVPLGSLLSVYPRFTVGFESVKTEQQVVSGSWASVAGSPLGYPSTTQTGPWIELYVPLLVHLRPHFFAGIGPSLFRDFAHVQGGPDVGGQRTTFGGGAVVGGTWGGVAPAVGQPAAEPAPAPHRFGEQGQIVLDNEVTAAVHGTSYDGSASSNLTASVEPSLDYFLADHFSIGIAPYLSYAKASGVDSSTGALVNYERTRGGIEPRAGFDVPLGRWCSLYGRAGLVLGAGSYNETAAGSANQNSNAFSAVHAFVPLLVHPAPHVFAGFGPSLYWEFSDTVTYPSGSTVQNRNTSLGASLVVGGWI